MARRSSRPDGGRRIHPQGLLRTVDNVVRERVRKAIDEQGLELQEVAKKLNIVPASMTNFLKPGPPRQVKFLPELFELLSIEDDLLTVNESWPDLSAEDRAVILALIRARTHR